MNRKHKSKVNELATNMSRLLKRECERLYNSGGIDTEKFNSDEYALAKILITVAMEAIKGSYYPLTQESKEDLHNLLAKELKE